MVVISFLKILVQQTIVNDSGHILTAFFRLYMFSAEPNFIPFKIEITEFRRSQNEEDDQSEVIISARGFGETFQLGKHPQGTEVKAITYSAMQIHESDGFSEVFVIIDI